MQDQGGHSREGQGVTKPHRALCCGAEALHIYLDTLPSFSDWMDGNGLSGMCVALDGHDVDAACEERKK